MDGWMDIMDGQILCRWSDDIVGGWMDIVEGWMDIMDGRL